MNVNELIEFLTVRLDEDEAVAEGVRPSGIRPWELMEVGDGVEYGSVCIDAARALAEVESKRAILALHRGTHRCEWGDLKMDNQCEARVLRLLAAVYADHPDYDQAWSPDRSWNPERNT